MKFITQVFIFVIFTITMVVFLVCSSELRFLRKREVGCRVSESEKEPDNNNDEVNISSWGFYGSNFLLWDFATLVWWVSDLCWCLCCRRRQVMNMKV